MGVPATYTTDELILRDIMPHDKREHELMLIAMGMLRRKVIEDIDAQAWQCAVHDVRQRDNCTECDDAADINMIINRILTDTPSLQHHDPVESSRKL